MFRIIIITLNNPLKILVALLFQLTAQLVAYRFEAIHVLALATCIFISFPFYPDIYNFFPLLIFSNSSNIFYLLFYCIFLFSIYQNSTFVFFCFLAKEHLVAEF